MTTTTDSKFTRLERAHQFLGQALWGFMFWNFVVVVCLGLPGHRLMPSFWAFLALGPVMFTYPVPRNHRPLSYSDYMPSKRPRTTWRTPCNDPVRGGE